MTKRKPRGREGGRPALIPGEETVKLEVKLPASVKAGLQFLAAQRSTWARREVTVSELVRDAIQVLLDGVTDSDKRERDAAIEALRYNQKQRGRNKVAR